MSRMFTGFLSSFIESWNSYNLRKKIVYLTQRDVERLINVYKSRGFSETEALDIINHNWKIVVTDYTK